MGVSQMRFFYFLFALSSSLINQQLNKILAIVDLYSYMSKLKKDFKIEPNVLETMENILGFNHLSRNERTLAMKRRAQLWRNLRKLEEKAVELPETSWLI